MASPLPYMNFYVKEWLASSGTRRLSLAARGLYADLICFQWEDGHLPDDTRVLARMVGVGHDEFVEAWSELEPHFPITEPGKRANERVAEDRTSALQKVEKRKEAGSKGGSASKQTESNQEPKQQQPASKKKANAKQMLEQTESKTQAIPEPDTDICVNTDSSSANAEGNSAFADPPDTAFGLVEAVLATIARKYGHTPPDRKDVLKHLRPDKPLRKLVEEFGVTDTVALWVYGWNVNRQGMSWSTLYENRGPLREKALAEQSDAGIPSTALSRAMSALQVLDYAKTVNEDRYNAWQRTLSPIDATDGEIDDAAIHLCGCATKYPTPSEFRDAILKLRETKQSKEIQVEVIEPKTSGKWAEDRLGKEAKA